MVNRENVIGYEVYSFSQIPTADHQSVASWNDVVISEIETVIDENMLEMHDMIFVLRFVF